MARAKKCDGNFFLTMVVVVSFCLLSVFMFRGELVEVQGYMTALLDNGTTMTSTYLQNDQTVSAATTQEDAWMRSISHLTSTSNPPPLDGGQHNYIACHNDTIDDTVPAFVIAGVQKGGTTALAAILKQHPNLLGNKKFETHFFDFGDPLMKDLKQAAVQFHSETMRQVSLAQTQNTTNLKGRLQHSKTKQLFPRSTICNIRQRYLSKHFLEQNKPRRHSLSGGQVLAQFEKTPVYICRPEVPILMQMVVPWAKVLLILRNPVDRAYSSFKMCREIYPSTCNPVFEVNVEKEMVKLKRNRPQRMQQIPTLTQYRQSPHLYSNESFFNGPDLHPAYQMHAYGNNVVGMIRRGFYAEQLIPWLRHYTLNVNLKVISYDYFQSNKRQAINEIMDFLQLPRYNFTTEQLEKHYPITVGRKNPPRYKIPIDPLTKDYLQKLYAPHNRQLEALLGPEWKGIWET